MLIADSGPCGRFREGGQFDAFPQPDGRGAAAWRFDGASATLASYQNIDRQVLEKAGFASLMLGTLTWGLGDLAGRL